LRFLNPDSGKENDKLLFLVLPAPPLMCGSLSRRGKILKTGNELVPPPPLLLLLLLPVLLNNNNNKVRDGFTTTGTKNQKPKIKNQKVK
jgi:hypothetical protein